jgi:ribonucleoside-diphosphate reductase alpha chain
MDGNMTPTFAAPISRHIWETRYRYDDSGPGEADIDATWWRVAGTLASVEPRNRDQWRERFHTLLEGFKFLPGGRILAGAGTSNRVTLFNCFVMGTIPDSLPGILDALKEGALTMQQGGGVGYDFSTLRPLGSEAPATGTIASGPVSFMRIWDSTCATLLSTGARRGAMMGTLRCDHPDIETFVDAKRDRGELRHFNVSVLVSDAFMAAVDENSDWPLVFPESTPGPADAKHDGQIVMRPWPGTDAPTPCRVYRVVKARELWERIMRAAYDCAEPGVLFIDRINASNNLAWREHISATNPCGEIPLPPYGACDLGAMNLTRFVRDAFEPGAHIDTAALEEAVAIAVRMLDNVIDASDFPLPAQQEQARGSRRIGLGITGLADALLMLGFRYDSDAGRTVAADAMRTVCHGAYRASANIAREKGCFPFFDAERFMKSPFVAALPADLRKEIHSHGIRNSHLTAIAPTGTISLLANGISNGIEPVFAARYRRAVLNTSGGTREFDIEDAACRQWRMRAGDDSMPPSFVDVSGIAPRDHLAMQAALQPYVDEAISKTVNVPEGIDFAAFRSLYKDAYTMGLKGVTAFRPNSVTGAVVTMPGPEADSAHCCTIEREVD